MNINKYIIENEDVRLTVLNVGAILYDFERKIDNEWQSFVLKYDELDIYKNSPDYIGASVCGRNAGRIANASYQLNNKTYHLEKNFRNKHNLHSGSEGLHSKIFDINVINNEIHARYEDVSIENDNTIEIKVILKLTNNGFTQIICGNTNSDTIFNPTNHSYFTLDQDKDVLDYEINLNSEYVYYLNEDLLPADKIKIEDSIFKGINDDVKLKSLKTNNEQFSYTGFIDHSFKLNTNQVYIQNDKYRLSLTTNQDFIVVYTGNQLASNLNLINNKSIYENQGICLETQKVPNGINIEEFRDDYILRKDEEYIWQTTYELTER